MKSKLTCEQCGAANEIGRLFCGQCGERLNLTGFRPGRPRRGVGAGRAGGIKRLVRLVLLAALLTLLIALLWPTAPQGKPGTSEQGEALYENLLNMEQSIRRRERARLTIQEEEINAYLGMLIAQMDERPAENRSRLKTQAVNLSFTPEYVIVHILTAWGPVRLSYEITGWPRVNGRGASLDAQRVRLGHVPMPDPLMARMAERLGNVFAQLEREQFILRHVTRVDLGDGLLRLTTE